MASRITPNISSTPVAETAPVSSGPQKIFFGPKGLRAGWRILIFLMLVVVLRYGVGAIRPLGRWARSLNSNGQTAAVIALTELINVVVVFAAAGLMTFIDKRTFADYGLPWNQAFGKRFWQGLPLGFVMLTLLLGSIGALHGYSIDGAAMAGSTAVKFGVLWGFAFLLTGFFEEFAFRGYLQSALGDGIGFWPAAILLGIGFGVLHMTNPGEAIFGALMAGSFGLVAAFALWRTGNLWLPIGMHAAWDWGETYFYGTPDSGLVAPGHLLNSSFHGAKWLTGGTVGPEGSWLVFAVLPIWALAIHFLFPAKRPSAAA
jgi:uncharacterized protein